MVEPKSCLICKITFLRSCVSAAHIPDFCLMVSKYSRNKMLRTREAPRVREMMMRGNTRAEFHSNAIDNSSCCFRMTWQRMFCFCYFFCDDRGLPKLQFKMKFWRWLACVVSSTIAVGRWQWAPMLQNVGFEVQGCPIWFFHFQIWPITVSLPAIP